MKRLIYIASSFFLLACEKEVYIPLKNPEPFLVVDGWINTRQEEQKVVLTYTRPYFDNSGTNPAVGAEVQVINVSKEDTLAFLDVDDSGIYKWSPSGSATIGETGDVFVLDINFQGVRYQSATRLDPVPTLDSITYEYYPKEAFVVSEYYYGDFWAKDLPGEGNTYWIKTWKNGKYLNQPSEINYAYDGGFSSGAPVDSLIFIQPIRGLMNPIDTNEDDLILPPYVEGDSAYVEIHSISNEAWFFLARVQEETNVSGGFGALFATPLANVPTNIVPDQVGVKVAGFFNVANISSLGAKVDENTMRDNIKD